MKNWLKRVPKEKLQRYIFFSMLFLLFAVFIIALSLTGDQEPNPNDNQDEEPGTQQPPVASVEKFVYPFQGSEYVTVFKYFIEDIPANADDSEYEVFELFGNKSVNSIGIAYAKPDDKVFQVVATLSGKVISVTEQGAYGIQVLIEHEDGFTSEYRCLSEALVEVGDEVKQFDAIGLSGASSMTFDKTNYVYFIIRENKIPVNPSNLFNKTTSEVMTKIN